ncbi:MAG: hypothetical protein ACTMIA_12585, partial [Vibrio sp.]
MKETQQRKGFGKPHFRAAPVLTALAALTMPFMTVAADTASAPSGFDAYYSSAVYAGMANNGGVENGLNGWSSIGGKITRSLQESHSGAASILIYSRTQTWNGI